MYRVGIIGPESTGKSTLATYLAHRYGGVLVSEYAREYMERLAPAYAYTYEDVVAIAQQQVRELATPRAESEVVFYDTELIITKVWFLHKYGKCPDFLLHAIEQYPMDVYLMCYPDMAWQPDPVRENPTIREYLFQWYEKEVQALGVPYYIIRHQ